jgi:hypothetical protein
MESRPAGPGHGLEGDVFRQAARNYSAVDLAVNECGWMNGRSIAGQARSAPVGRTAAEDETFDLTPPSIEDDEDIDPSIWHVTISP